MLTILQTPFYITGAINERGFFMAENTIQSIERAADVLELFLGTATELSVKEISDALGLSKSTVHGIIKTLEIRSYLKQNPENSKYGLGLKVFELGNVMSKHLDIRDISKKPIQALVDQVNETVHLAVYNQGEVVYVEKIEVPHTIQISSQVGKQAKLYCTGVGKAVLAFLNDDEIERILAKTELIKYTENTHTDLADIYQDLRQIRKQLYSIDDEEIEQGLFCVAAPIFDFNGRVTGAISCSVPEMRITEEKLPIIVESVRRCGLQISTLLGLNVELLAKYTDKSIYSMYLDQNG